MLAGDKVIDIKLAAYISLVQVKTKLGGKLRLGRCMGQFKPFGWQINQERTISRMKCAYLN